MNDIRERGYHISRATLLDLRAVYHLERVIFPKDAYPYLDLTLLFLLPGLVNLKAVAPDGSLVGFVCAGRMVFQTIRWIITLGINPAHQNRGVGRALLLRAEQRVKGENIRLTVRESNTPAITLYRHTGYQIIERKYAYYRDGEAGLIMEKRLKSE